MRLARLRSTAIHIPGTVLLLAGLCPGVALGQTVTVREQRELVRALADASPGTTILIAPGRYEGGLFVQGRQGAAGRPIVVAAAVDDQPPVIEGGASGIHLSAVSHLELRNLVFTGARGNGINIDDGGAQDGSAHHLRLIGLTVREVGPRGNRDGIKLSGLDDFLVERCTIERWGDGGSGIDMVGCHRGVVTGCTFANRRADSSNGVQSKGGSREIVIRRCRFDDAGGRGVNIGGSTGLEYFRPRPESYEAKDITVEDCTFTGSLTPIAYVGVDGSVVRYNTIYRPRRWGLRILQENQGPGFTPCRGGRFEHNIIAFRSDEISTMVNVGGGTSPDTFTFAGNLWYCLDRPEATRRMVQLPVPEQDGRYDADPGFIDAAQGNFELRDRLTPHVGVRPMTPDDAR